VHGSHPAPNRRSDGHPDLVDAGLLALSVLVPVVGFVVANLL